MADDKLFDAKPAARRSTKTKSFGVPTTRENHDSSSFYERFERRHPSLGIDLGGFDADPELEFYDGPDEVMVGDARKVPLPDDSVAMVITSPPYFVGKDYELGADSPQTWDDYLDLLQEVWAEQLRVLEPGGRIAVNVAGLGRKPYRPLPAIVTTQLLNAGFQLRGEIVWVKAKGSGSMATGTWNSPHNPVMRDLTERVIVASKGQMSRVKSQVERRDEGLPYRSDLESEIWCRDTIDMWRIAPELATRIGHPAPFPVELPRRLIRLHTYEQDLVVDPFCGSGSTLLAASELNRRFVGIDKEQRYVDMAEQRLKVVEPVLPFPTDAVRLEVVKEEESDEQILNGIA